MNFDVDFFNGFSNLRDMSGHDGPDGGQPLGRRSVDACPRADEHRRSPPPSPLES